MKSLAVSGATQFENLDLAPRHAKTARYLGQMDDAVRDAAELCVAHVRGEVVE